MKIGGDDDETYDNTLCAITRYGTYYLSLKKKLHK